MQPTPYDDLNAVLGELVRAWEATLGGRLVGAYLQGSFAIGDFDRHSDVDFVAVVRTPLQDRHVQALQAAHAQVFDGPCRWAQHLEGSYFPLDVLRDVTNFSTELWYLDNGSRQLVRSDHCNSVVVRRTLREHGVRLVGTPPAALLDPVPWARVRRSILRPIHEWGPEILAQPERWANRFYQGFILLNFCRMWCDLTCESLGSKRRGATWALERLGPGWADLLDRAWTTRPEPATSSRTPADPADYRRTLELVQIVIDATAGAWEAGPPAAPA